MRKFSAIFLFTVFVNFSIGYYLEVEYSLHRIRREVKHQIIERIPDSELEIIPVTPAIAKQLQWFKPKKEFRYHEAMYDVVHLRKSGDTTYYYCFNDKMESRLRAKVDKYMKDLVGRIQSRLRQSGQIMFFNQIEPYDFLMSFVAVSYYDFSTRYFGLSTDVLSPPPRVIVS